MADGAPKLESTSGYAFVPPAAWEVRAKILSEMQQLGASLEKVKKIIGPEPPQIEYKLLDGPMPKIGLEPGERWSSREYLARSNAALQEFQIRQDATFRQAYCSFMGEGEDPEPPDHRTLEVKDLIERAAQRLLGRPWKNIADTDATRKAVINILKWTRLDPASIARNTAAAARGIIKEIETWHEQGNELTEDDQRQLADAQSTLARLSTSTKTTNRNETKSRKAIGRPKKPIDGNLVRKLRSAGASWSKIAADLKISATTARRVYIQAPRRLAKSL